MRFSTIAKLDSGATFQRGTRRRAGRLFTHALICNGSRTRQSDRRKGDVGYWLPSGEQRYACIISWHTSRALADAALAAHGAQFFAPRVEAIVGWDS